MKDLGKKVNHLIAKMKRFKDMNSQGKYLYDQVKFIEKGYENCALNLNMFSQNLTFASDIKQKKNMISDKEEVNNENLKSLHAAQRFYNEFV
jgi:hypothetical protein